MAIPACRQAGGQPQNESKAPFGVYLEPRTESGGLAERFKATVSKTVHPKGWHRFKSCTLRPGAGRVPPPPPSLRRSSQSVGELL